MPRVIRLLSEVADEDLAPLEHRFIDERSFRTLISREDVDVYRSDDSLLLRHRIEKLPIDICEVARPALRKVPKPNDNRGSSGKRRPRLRKDGMPSNRLVTPKNLTNTAGYSEATPSEPYCRQTSFTANEVKHWPKIVGYMQAVDAVFRSECYEGWSRQMQAVRRTAPHYIVKDTSFTTITVNKNYRTVVHKDRGDLPEGFGVMSCLRSGDYDGCYLVFPKYEIAVDLHDRDVLFADVHEWHGNTPFIGVAGEYERLSTVLYFRSKMQFCGTPEQELARLKGR